MENKNNYIILAFQIFYLRFDESHCRLFWDAGKAWRVNRMKEVLCLGEGQYCDIKRVSGVGGRNKGNNVLYPVQTSEVKQYKCLETLAGVKTFTWGKNTVIVLL